MEAHSALLNQANSSVDTLPAYKSYEEHVPSSQDAQAKKKRLMLEKAFKVVGGKESGQSCSEGSGGRSRGIGGVGNHAKGHVRGE